MRRISLFVWYRIVVLGIIALLLAVGLLFLRGPVAWQRMYYPLEHRDDIAVSSARHKVNPYLVAAVINAESDWNPSAQSEAGAVGLMQVMPSTAAELARRAKVDAREFSPTELARPAVNIEYGTAYLRYLVERYHEVETALAAYNAGLANADTWAAQGGDIKERIEFPATRHFVLKVSRGRDRYVALYPNEFEGWKR